MKDQIQIHFGDAGSAFLDMTLMVVNGSMASTGSLSSGTGALTRKFSLAFKGEASEHLKGLLQKAEWAEPKEFKTHPKRLLLRFGRLTIPMNCSIGIKGGEHDESPAVLSITATGDAPKDDNESWNMMGLLWGEMDTLILLIDDDADMQLPLDDHDLVTVHAADLDPQVIDLGDLDDALATIIRDRAAIKAGEQQTADEEPGDKPVQLSTVRKRKAGTKKDEG